MINSCEVNLPFVKENICVESCNLVEFNNGICKLDNEIIETQWINNIIFITNKIYTYVNMVTTQNEDIIILMSTYSDIKSIARTRLFYCLTKEGRGFFNQENKIYSLQVGTNTSLIQRYESEIFLVKLKESSNKKEYLLSFGKLPSLIEIYDLETMKVVYKDISTAFDKTFVNLRQHIGAYLKLNSNTENYYLIGFISEKSGARGVTYIINLIAFSITKIDPTTNTLTLSNLKKIEINTSTSLFVSCYETEKFFIICFFKDINNKYAINVYSSTLQSKLNTTIATGNSNENLFFKCTHFTGEVGAFIYYSNTDPPYANLVFKQYSDNKLNDYISKIEFKDYSFFFNQTTNDIIKVSDKKIYYIALSSNLKDLYFISIYNYYNKQYIKKIYKINTFLYNVYHFLKLIKINIYNNFLSMISNGYRSDSFSYATLIIFSYPNSTDFRNELTDYLFNNNEIKINNINLGPKNLCMIENNIFGFILAGIKIIEIYKSNNKYLSFSNETEISQNMLVNVEENLTLTIPKTDKIYEIFSYGIEYVCLATEPEYEQYNKYPIIIEDTGMGTSKTEKNYFQNQIYSGRYTFYNFSLNSQLTEEGCKNNCELCYVSNKNKCITCKSDFNITNNNKICYEEIITTVIETTVPEQIDTTISETNRYNYSGTNICTYKEILEESCPGELTDEMAEDIYYYIKKELINKNFTQDNKLIKTPSVTFQLTTLDFQKNYNNLNISTIDLGECENKLKEENNIGKEYSLIIYKIDIQNSNKTITYVQYEIYDPITFRKLDLDVCKNILIDIYVPAYLDSETLLLYESLNGYGYNLFNPNDIFYNDICTPYTTLNNTDILLIDRKNDYFNKYANLTICQESCDLFSYNKDSKKAGCNCNIQKNESEINLKIETKFSFNNLNDMFFIYLNNSNFRVLKCYKVAIDLTTVLQNIGRIIMTIILILFIILFIIFIIKGNKQIKKFIQLILKDRYNLKANNKKNNLNIKNKSNIQKETIKNDKKEKKSKINKDKNKKSKKINNNKKIGDKKKGQKIKQNPLKRTKTKLNKKEKKIITFSQKSSLDLLMKKKNRFFSSNTSLIKEKLLNNPNNLDDNMSNKKIKIDKNNTKNNILFYSVINIFYGTLKNDNKIKKIKSI